MLCLMGRALRDDPNKQGAGNAGLVVRRSASSSRRVLSGRGSGFAGGFFGIGLSPVGIGGAGRSWAGIEVGAGRSGRLDRGGLVDRAALVAGRGRNGGFPPFRLRSAHRVRMAESEWQGQGLGFAGFAAREDQPGRLHQGAGRRAGTGPEGVNPLRRAAVFLIPVALAGHQSGQKTASRSAANSLCQADHEARSGREIPSSLMGSGVRAAQCAGVNDRSVCRPKSPEMASFSEGLGEKWSRSCAKGVNEAGRLGAGVGGVN